MSIPVHIYPLSRLVHAAAAEWENELRAIEEGKKYAFGYYLPLREAVVTYCRNDGKRRDQIVKQMTALALSMGGIRGAEAANANDNAFRVFETSFFPRITRFHESFLHTDFKAGCPFEGVTLLGLPHLRVTDDKGGSRYVHLHAAQWEPEDLKAYLELLSVIVENRFKKHADAIWCMDLKSGRDFKWQSRPRMRTKCVKAARLYARLIKAMTQSEE